MIRWVARGWNNLTVDGGTNRDDGRRWNRWSSTAPPASSDKRCGMKKWWNNHAQIISVMPFWKPNLKETHSTSNWLITRWTWKQPISTSIMKSSGKHGSRPIMLSSNARTFWAQPVFSSMISYYQPSSHLPSLTYQTSLTIHHPWANHPSTVLINHHKAVYNIINQHNLTTTDHWLRSSQPCH